MGAPLQLVVGLHGGGLNGIDTYAEQVALAAAAAGHQVTLLATGPAGAERLRPRLAGLTVEHLGLPAAGRSRALIERLSPSAALGPSLEALRHWSARHPRPAVWHLNRPPLAGAVQDATRTCVAAWFYPHALWDRLLSTWDHVGGPWPRRAIIAAKAIDFYRCDQRGFRAADWIVAPTELLAEQLRSQGYRVFQCPPPRAAPAGAAAPLAAEPLRFAVCSGDLSHPRKNLKEAIAALARLPPRRGPITLVAIGRNPESLVAQVAREAPALKLELRGPLEPAGVLRELQRCHALLFPSRYEEWGYAAVESLLGGTPVVSYPVYPFAEMLAGLGAVARGRQVSDFAEAIERALALPRGAALSQLSAQRFGSAAIGERLTPLWAGELE